MSSTRKIAALPIVAAALMLGIFGVVRGASSTGPARGTRLIVAIQPPVDDAARTMAEHVVRARLDEPGVELRVVQAGDQLVIEVPEEDPELVAQQVAVIERRGKLEIHRVVANPWLASIGTHATANPPSASSGIRVAEEIVVADDRWEDLPVAAATAIGCTGRGKNGKRNCLVRGDGLLAGYFNSIATDPQLAVPDGHLVAYGRVGDSNTWRPYLLDGAVILDGAAIWTAQVLSGGVEITVAAGTLTNLTAGTSIAFLLDGRVKFAGTAEHVAGTTLHVATDSRDDGIQAAFDLVNVVEAGAVRPLRVARQEAFSRATGFLPRAWPFLAIGAALLVVAALLWRSAR